jgi:hypothetical protein
MSKLLHAAALVLAFGPWLGAPPPVGAATPVELAINRCNSQTIDEASRRVGEYDRRLPSSQAQLLERFAAIAEVISTLSEEHEILGSVCSNEAERAQFFAQIAATTAWALVLEADVTARLNAACPAAARAFPTMMLADAWLALANVINENSGTVPSSFNDVIPKIQTRGQAVDLALPTWADTSQYWRDQIHTKGKAAIATCPSPSPAPSS